MDKQYLEEENNMQNDEEEEDDISLDDLSETVFISKNTLKSKQQRRKLQMKQEPRNVKSSRNSLRP